MVWDSMEEWEYDGMGQYGRMGDDGMGQYGRMEV